MSDKIVNLPNAGAVEIDQPWYRRMHPARFFKGAYDYRPLMTGYGPWPLLLFLLMGFMVEIPNETPFLGPLVKHDLGLNYTKFFTLTSAVGTVGILLAGPLGYLADRAKRTTLVGLSAILSGVSTLGTGLGYTPLTYGAASAVGVASGDLGGIPSFSLMADYYPVDQRVNVAALRNLAGKLTAVVLPLPVALWAQHAGWRVPFWFFWIPSVAIGLVWIFKMPEPVRGYQERKAMGASEEVAMKAQAAPSWGESFRVIWNVRMVRISVYLSLLSSVGGLFTQGSQFYFIDVYHVTPTQLAAIGTVGGVIGLLILLFGGGIMNAFAKVAPTRLLQFSGAISLVAAGAGLMLVLSPNFWLATASGWIFSGISGLTAAALYGISLNIMPPRARGAGLAILIYFQLPVRFLGPLGGVAIDNWGLKATLVIGSLFPVVSAIISIWAAKFYEPAVRNSRISAMALEEHDQARKKGVLKQLLLRQVDVFYGSVQVLFGVDLEINEGEMVALLGTNGAGKSTVLRAVSGLTEATQGAVLFDGEDITHVPPNEIAQRGIVYMQGGRSGFPSLTVRENLELGSWMHGRKPDQEHAMERVFTYFPILRERLGQVAGTLSGGEQQMLALSQAFLTRPKLLLIDELSLGLAPAVVDQLLEIVRAIHRNGTTVVLVEQSVNTALRIAERAIFMEKGEVRFTGPTAELLHRPDILRSIFLKTATAAGAERQMESVSGFATGGLTVAARRGMQLAGAQNILDVQHIEKAFGGHPVLRDVSFQLREGEILGIIGANGAGKTTLFDVLSGFTPEDSGRIIFNGDDVTALAPDARARLGLIRRFQDARLFPTLTVGETIAIYFERQLESRNTLLSGVDLPATRRQERRVRSMVENLVELMQLGSFRDKFVSELSTGTRRIVDLACVIATGPKVLLLDEPSAGIAQKEAEEMGPLLQRVRFQTGCSMIVIEHDMSLISALADELLVMHLGEVMMRGTPKTVLEDERVVSAYLGRPVEGAPA